MDTAGRRLELADGRRLDYGRLLIATGSSPVKPSIPGLDHPVVHQLWTLDDALTLDRLLRRGARMLVLGSGFVALQTAWAACRRGLAVTVAELEERIMPRVLDEPAAHLLHRAVVAHGVAVGVGIHTERLESHGPGAVRVHTRELDPFDVDVVIVGTGVRPNDGLLPEALESGLPGIPVGIAMETSVGGVFAAGDVTRGPTAAGGPPEIHALWPTAVEQGKVAGANLAGVGLVYGGSLSMNVTEMFGATVASLGRFVESDGERVHVYDDIPGVEYLKIVTLGGVPVGAVAVGGPEVALLLGRLRPFVRQGRAVRRLRTLLQEAPAVRLLHVPWADGAAAYRVSPKKVESCAS